MPGNAEIEAHRPEKNPVNPRIPYHYLHEREPDHTGKIRQVHTIFLTNKECPFRCLMCDLWKNTLDRPTPEGATPQQIRHALERLPGATVIKLYNSGNFFDTGAIPRSDYRVIAEMLSGYDRVIVENHPRMCNERCIEFAGMLDGKLEIAIGLETIHPEVLPRLNKQFTVDDFVKAAEFLRENGIDLRTFLLLNPPYLTETEKSMEWALKSAEFARRQGAGASTIIPTRPGNGIMEVLQKRGDFVPPTLRALEKVFEKALDTVTGRIFVDLWDLEQFSTCSRCFQYRKKRLHKMNLKQQVLPRIRCQCHEA
ncbi:MAG: hypothetical protein R3281_03190 [Balneolaceae bacterium]|nr:hypothetical protein [Balneolaceae bacterium]